VPDPNPAGEATVNYTVTFNEAVTGVTAANFAIAGTGSTGATVGTPTGSGTTWTVPVTVGTATGLGRHQYGQLDRGDERR
jgi:hypothetical protein